MATSQYNGKYVRVPAPLWYTGRVSRNSVQEHISVACQAAGITCLPAGHHVHHIDCNKSNNNPSNLIIVSPGVHSKIHTQMRTRNSSRVQEVLSLIEGL